jgi:hypothetical protein
MSDKPAGSEPLTPKLLCEFEVHAFYRELVRNYGDEIARAAIAELLRSLLSHHGIFVSHYRWDTYSISVSEIASRPLGVFTTFIATRCPS